MGSAGLHAGTLLPPFAAPLATGPVPDGDVNVARKADQGAPVAARPATCAAPGS